MRLLSTLLAGALVLTACGSDDDGDAAADTTAGTASGTAAAAGAGFPVTIEGVHGDVTIEEAPERVAAVGLTDQDALLALGVAPVATNEWFGEQPGAIWPWATDELEATGAEAPAIIGSQEGINFEAVAAADPDLIVALYADLTDEEYSRLSSIAPTVTAPDGLSSFGISWQEQTTIIGRALGKEDEAEALVEEVQAAVDEAKAAHPEFDGASAVMATPYEGIFVYGPEDPRGRFLAALGFELPADLVAFTGDQYGGNLSQERADLLDVDAIVWLDAEDADGALGGPLYEGFAVHQEGREVFLDSFEDPLGAATSFVTVLSLPFLLDGIVPKLVAAVDGDPATDPAEA